MKQDNKNKPLLNIKKKKKPQILLSTNELAAVAIIQSWGWKKGAGNTVWEAAFETARNYNKWYRKLYKAKIDDSRFYKFRSYLLDILPNEYNFLIEYFKYIHKTRSLKQNFSGDLMNYVWRADNDWWKLQGYEYADKWCGNTLVWDYLIKIIEDKK